LYGNVIDVNDQLILLDEDSVTTNLMQFMVLYY